MGRKNNVCIPNIPCSSMEQQTMKVRPVLLNRSVDISDLTKETNQRKIKSHQVRFKEDNSNPKPPNFAEFDKKPRVETLLVNGKEEKSHNRSMCLLAYPHSQKRLKNIATQTSPSLRKHFPNFKTRKVKETKPKDIISSESSCDLINGDLTDELDNISCLRLTDQFEEGLKWVRRRCPVRHTVPKAQSNGPRNECSGMEFVKILGRVTVSTQVSENVIVSPLQETEEPNIINVKNHQSPETVNNYMMLECSEKCSLTIDKPSDISIDLTNTCGVLKQSKVLLPVKPNVDCKTSLTLTPSINKNVSYCIHSKLQQTDKVQSLSESHLHDNHVLQSFTNNDRLQIPHINISELQKKPAQSSTLFLPNTGMEHCFNNESNEVPSDYCSLQGKLQSTEEALQSNQEKIKILLNVIEDLEKTRAFSEGRIFYRTGQDLSNCSTCQSRACIIYSVEYDFRQQEERFYHIMKNLDKLEPSPVLMPLPKPEPECMITEKPGIRRKTKKVKKKCFWWI